MRTAWTATLFIAMAGCGGNGDTSSSDSGNTDSTSVSTAGSAGSDGPGGTSASGGSGSGSGGGGAGGSGAGSSGSAGSGASAFVPAYPGQPPAGKIVWGASIGGNADPVPRHETPSGHALAVHRTFFQWSQRATSMINMAKDDVEHTRLPWVSVKTPSWAEMAGGMHDDEIDQMLKALANLSGSVWLTVHHEPEGGGGNNSPDDPAGPAGHLGMNERVRQRMTALGTKNIALAPILMSYTWNPVSKRDPNEWWKDGIYDFLGVDHYRDDEATLLTSVWDDVRTWAKGKGAEVAVGEWGVRGTDAAAGQRVRDWYDAAAGSGSDGKGARVVGLSAFDSSLNSPSGSWELQGEQLNVFWELLGDPRTAHVP